MIPWGLIIKNGKLILVLALGALAMMFYTKYNNAIDKSNRLEKNQSQENKKDSTGFSEVTLTKPEIKEKVLYDPELKQILKENKIELRRLRKIVTTQNEYIFQDTTKYVLHEILKGIREGNKAKQRVQSKNDCHLVAANIHFNGKDLIMDSLLVKTITRSDIVASVEKWKLRHIFKKRKVTVTTVDKCGNSQTEIVNLEKNKKK